jgi:hypothetical protein
MWTAPARLSLRLGLGWAKSHSFATGQCPVIKCNRGLMMCNLYDKVRITDAVNATVIPLDAAPEGYSAFDSGAAKKFVLDPNGYSGRALDHWSGRTSPPIMALRWIRIGAPNDPPERERR